MIIEACIIDDENTSKYYPGDRFSVSFRSVSNDINFMESHLYSESNQTFLSGSLAGHSGAKKARYYPRESNGTNVIEVPLSMMGAGGMIPLLTGTTPFMKSHYSLRPMSTLRMAPVTLLLKLTGGSFVSLMLQKEITP